MQLMDLGQFAIFLGIAAVCYVGFAHRSALTETSIVPAQYWALSVLVSWTAAWILDLATHVVSADFADYIWYASALLSLCPPIAVLGARRPGSRFWNTFILVPLLFVLGWPIAAVAIQASQLHGLQLENPQLVPFILILVMGVGNYFGTRYTISALLYGLAVVSSVTCLASNPPAIFADRQLVRFWSTLGMVAAVLSTRFAGRETPSSRFDRLWFDFFDTFGIVWGRRIQDRVNYLAQKECLSVRLELDGFVWKHPPEIPDSPPEILETDRETSNDCEARVEHIMRWLLRRFVDQGWIDARLNGNSKQPVSQFVVDS